MSETRLISVELHNAFQHENVLIRLDPGLVGLLGSNGNGKTNLTLAIEFALTGEATGPSGKKKKRADVLRHGTDYGYVELRMERDGVEYVLRRELHKDAQSLTFGGTTQKLVGDINKTLATLYGMPVGDVYQALFMRQSAFQSFLWSLPAQRGASLQPLFTSLDTDKVMETLQQVRNTVPPSPDLGGVLAECHRLREESLSALAAADGRANGAREALETLQPLYESSLARLQLPVVGSADAAISAQQSKVESLAAALASHASARPLIPDRPAAPDPDGARKLATLESYRRELERHSSLVARRDGVDRSLAEVPADAGIADAEERLESAKEALESGRFKLSSIDTELGVLNVTKKLYDTGGRCPITGGSCPAVPAEGERKLFMVRHAECESRRKDAAANVEKLLAAAETARRAVQKVEAANAANAQRRQALSREQTTADGDVRKCVADLNDMYALLSGFDAEAHSAAVAALNAFNAVESAAARHDAETVRKQAILAAERQRLSDLSKPVVGITAAEKRDAEVAVDMHRRQRADLDEAVAARSKASAALAVAEDRIRRTEADMAEGKVRELVRADLDALRDFFHRGNGPALVIRSNLGRYNREMGRVLEDMNFGIRAWVTPDFEFLYDKVDNGAYGRPVTELSGAEGVIVAIAERLARLKVVECRLPLLSMDEPAAPLSKDNLPKLAGLFEKLRATVGRHWCMLVPSHADELEACFERRIHVGQRVQISKETSTQETE